MGYILISIGSASNVDPDSLRARILKFNLTTTSLPLDYSSGILFADGLRNEVGIRLDRNGNMWGVENGCDNL
jgi:glucose/arabinose dehydrogenase